jgi:hypothetical protein
MTRIHRSTTPLFEVPYIFQIDNLPVASSPAAGDVYWYQLVVASKTGTQPKVFDIYATVDASGKFVPYNPPAGTGSANSPTTAIDGNAIINNTAMQLTVGLQPDASLRPELLAIGFNTAAPVHKLSAPVAGHGTSEQTFIPVAGQNGTGVTVAEGYTNIQIPGKPAGTYYDNPDPSITITSNPDLSFGWTGSNNVARDDLTKILPTHPVFESSAPFTLGVVGQISQYTNKIVPENVAKVTFGLTPDGLPIAGLVATGVADLDGQWWTNSVRLGQGTYYATMQEFHSDGVTPYGGPKSAELTIDVNLQTLGFQNTGGNYLQFDPGAGGVSGNWIKLQTTGSSLPNGTLLAYATDAGGNMLDRDGNITTNLADAVLASIGSVAFDNGVVMQQGAQSVYLPVGQQLHFAIQAANNSIELLTGVQTTGTGTLNVNVNGGFGTLNLSAVVENTLSADAMLAAGQRSAGQPWVHLTNGSTVHVDVQGSAYNNNAIHFVRIDVDPGSGGWSVGGVAYPRHALKTFCGLIVPGGSPQSLVELRNLGIKTGNMLEVSLAQFAHQRMQ